MLVFVEDSAQALVSSYPQAGDLLLVSDRRGQRMVDAEFVNPGTSTAAVRTSSRR